jgi:RNA polymerase sigma-70 factor (ECF subfamily)
MSTISILKKKPIFIVVNIALVLLILKAGCFMKERKPDKEAFISLVNQNLGIIHKVSLTYCYNCTDREDLVQEIFFQLWRSYDSYKGESRFSTWLYRVALNTAINSLRKKKDLVNMETLPDTRSYEVRDMEKEEQTRLLFSAISQLNKIDKALIFLWLEERKYDEISEITGLSKTAVSVRLVRIRKKLEEIIKSMEK